MKKISKFFACAAILTCAVSFETFARNFRGNETMPDSPKYMNGGNLSGWNCQRGNYGMMRNGKNAGRNFQNQGRNLVKEFSEITGVVSILGKKENPLITIACEDGNVYAIKTEGGQFNPEMNRRYLQQKQRAEILKNSASDAENASKEKKAEEKKLPAKVVTKENSILTREDLIESEGKKVTLVVRLDKKNNIAKIPLFSRDCILNTIK